VATGLMASTGMVLVGVLGAEAMAPLARAISKWTSLTALQCANMEHDDAPGVVMRV
jgi:hypothetical protein